MQHKYSFILFLFLGALSIAFKIFGGESITRSQTPGIEGFNQYINLYDFSFIESFDLNKEGTFSAHVFLHRNCLGGVLVTPMYRNSEAVSLFERHAVYKRYEIGSVFFLFNSRRYEDFPDFGLWALQKINSLKRVLGLYDDGIMPVFAIKEFGECRGVLMAQILRKG